MTENPVPQVWMVCPERRELEEQLVYLELLDSLAHVVPQVLPEAPDPLE